MAVAASGLDGAPGAERSAHRDPISGYAVAMMALCTFVAMSEGYDVQAMALAAPLVRAQWHLAFAQVGLLLSLSAVGLVIGSFLLSPMGDGVGRRPAILYGLLVAGLGTGLGALAPDLGALLATRLIAGVGLGLALPNLVAIALELMPLRAKTFAVVLVSCGYPLGASAGAAAASALLPRFGWPCVFVIGGSVTASAFALSLVWLPESPSFLVRRPGRAKEMARLLARLQRPARPEPVRPKGGDAQGALSRIAALFTVERRTATILLWLMNLGNLALVYFYFSWMPSLLVGGGLDAGAAIRATSLFGAAGAVASFLMAYLLPRVGPVRVLASAYVVAIAATIALAGRGAVDWSLYGVVAVAGAAIIGSQFCLSAVVAQYYPGEIRATASGYATGVGRAGAILTPVAASAVIAVMGASRHALAIAIAPATIALFAALSLELKGGLRRGRDPDAESLKA